MSESEVKTGSCQCGAVTFRVAGPFRDLIMCHCDMCQKSSGHHIAATAAEDSAFTFIKDDGLTWYRSSDHAKRGFCSKCGSNLLWKMDGRDNTSIFVGCLEEDIDLPVSMHVFTGEKKSYYAIEDDAPQYKRYPGAPE